MDIQVLGCGDAFGSGGRLQTSFFIQTQQQKVLLDCGATILPALHRQGISSAEIDAVLITHFHGDHFGGLPFLLLEAAKRYNRTKPLQLLGPKGLEERLRQLLPLLYPGTEEVLTSFPIQYQTYTKEKAQTVGDIEVNAWEVKHAPDSLPHGLRITSGKKVLAFSGDTSWHENLIPLSQHADLFICECNFMEGNVPGHLSWEVLNEKLPLLTAKVIRLTHAGDEVLNNQQSLSLKILNEGEWIRL